MRSLTAGPLVYLTLETQKRGLDIGGWYPEKMRLSVAVTLADDEIRTFQEADIPELLRALKSADLRRGIVREFQSRPAKCLAR